MESLTSRFLPLTRSCIGASPVALCALWSNPTREAANRRPLLQPELIEQHAPLRVLLEVADTLRDERDVLLVVRGDKGRLRQDRTLSCLPQPGSRGWVLGLGGLRLREQAVDDRVAELARVAVCLRILREGCAAEEGRQEAGVRGEVRDPAEPPHLSMRSRIENVAEVGVGIGSRADHLQV